MPIKKSGTISLNAEIAQEFNDTNPNQKSEFYRGGSLVPDIPANSGVPTSNQISLSDFYGATNNIVINYSIFGGGGTGGYGLGDGSGSGRQSDGKASGIMTQSSYNTWAQTITSEMDPPSSAFIVSQAGGDGGANANRSDVDGEQGGSGYRGLRGGNGGTANKRGEDAPWGHWGAGGGGGGGDFENRFLGISYAWKTDDAGSSGGGGEGGDSESGTTTLDLSETYYLILGGAGFSSTGGSYAGGMGCPGVISFSVNLGTTINIFVAEPAGSGSTSDRGTTNVFQLNFVPTTVQSSGVQLTRIRP